MLALTDTSITEMALGAMLLTAKLGAPILLTAMAIGVFVGMIQSATQLQEATIAFVPKLFGVGLVILLPFLVIDLVVGSGLMSLGMMMLPPVFISLPFKLLLFVMVDGWSLIAHALVANYH